MLKTLENYQDEAAAVYYVDRAVARIRVAVKSPKFQKSYLEAQRDGNQSVTLLMLGFVDVEEIQSRWGDARLGEILTAATYIVTQPGHTLSDTPATVKKFWKKDSNLYPAGTRC